VPPVPYRTVTRRLRVFAQDSRRQQISAACGVLEPAGQSRPEMLPVSRRDLTALHRPGVQAGIVERDLLPVDIQSACDRWHRDILMLRGRMPSISIVTRLS